ncbi:glycosyltransferase family 1 protein [Saccharata proteae CBS 121410]|uniref:Glycosyltransferase family 1 protein n=1 Tax=Saccharata proteae CBS 121410 TaxID=1314787 RepID=A0A9P4I3G3_9PEZI|nr:glycosyltransferase family 1 protein [Saccharata proteae CBS 121410]
MAPQPPPPQGGPEQSAPPPNPVSQAAEAIAAAQSGQSSSAQAGPSRGQQNKADAEAAYPSDAPPAYNDSLGSISGENDGLGTNATVGDDGRVNINIRQKNNRLSNLLVPALRSQLDLASQEAPLPPPYIPPHLGGEAGKEAPPPMNVAIHVVGSRGDVQPFVALGKVLKDVYGHRVRLATHPVFKGFVEENGLEFFSIGGDPAELMAFMVKNPGLMPGFDTLRNGDVGKRRKGIDEMIHGCWRSCIETGDGFGVASNGNIPDDWASNDSAISADAANAGRPFIADAIIANPPSFAHVHCAEMLAIPLHMMFTMPWSPTQSFPHPLTNIQSSNADPSITNYMSYALVDMLTWQGLGDIINRFRTHTLNLEPISAMSAPGMLARLRVPYTYCWSPALIPKPKDWANHISISGFYFLNLATNFTPDAELAAFLDAGPPPVYIGFGSIVVDDPNAMTKLIFDAVRKTGVRALVSKGWGGFGADQLGIPEGVYMLGNVPHDWLFKKVSAVVHHGGAGTTAAGIACGKPTVVVPFFGDQPFWGAMVARAGAGPDPIPHKQLNSENLAEAIQEALKPTSQDRAKELSAKIAAERGTDEGALYFHQHLKVDELRCSLLPDHVAVWRVKRTQIRLSAVAAVVLANEGILSFSDLKLHRPREFEAEGGPTDPVTGVTGAVMGTITSMMMGVADFPIETLKALKIHPDSRRPRAGSGTRRPREDSSPRAGNEGKRPLSIASDSAISVGSSAEPSGSSGLPASAADTPSSPRESRPHAGSLGQALSRLGSRSRSNSRPQSPVNRPRDDSTSAPQPSNNFTLENAVDTGKGVQRMIASGFKAPMDVTMGLSKGFHNASRLYGEEPRQVEKVTDLQSGLKVATREFGQGLFEGISGLVTQPLKGARSGGAAGFVKGMGKGMAGVVLKPQAAAFAIPAYTMKGLYQEVRKPFGASIQNYIIAARTAQGWEEYSKITQPERAQIVGAYRFEMSNTKKKRNPGEAQVEAIQTLIQRRKEAAKTRPPSKSMSGVLPPQFRRRTTDHGTVVYEPQGHTPTSEHSHPHESNDAPMHPGGEPRVTVTEEEELEAAIRQSIAETSRGNPDEDALMARAIRASIAELERPMREAQAAAAPDEGEDAELKRAIQASLTELKGRDAANDDEAEHKRQVEEVLRQSLADAKLRHRRQNDSDHEWEDSEDEERDLKEAMALSSQESHRRGGDDVAAGGHGGQGIIMEDRTLDTQDQRHQGDHNDNEDEELRKAIEASHAEGARAQEEERKVKSEEEIVMEYVKKQSLAEEEHRRRAAQGRDGQGESSGGGAGGQ